MALFPAVTIVGLRGNEVAISYYYEQILRKLAPKWQHVSPRDTVRRINRHGLAEGSTKLIWIMNKQHVQARFVEQDQVRSARGMCSSLVWPSSCRRWRTVGKYPHSTYGWRRLVQASCDSCRSCGIRRTESWCGPPPPKRTWQTQDPVYLEDIARATLGSMMADLMEGKTASKCAPLNTFLKSDSRGHPEGKDRRRG